ncbi:chromosomal replication initiator protein DnaA [Treponema zioleckii]|uniref:chromosomal replication initiator protein DnaA n=1 Tax=Treponema zioleckii TaxID=331680 RepID=UPI00168BB651|nr:chromosomal replication initiator protein DnaA [Treponema zioleckii]
MSEQFYKDFFEESLNMIHEEYISSGKENEFKLWFNVKYVEETIDSITLSVPSELLWDKMIQKGTIERIKKCLSDFTGQELTINHITTSRIQKTEPKLTEEPTPAPTEKFDIFESAEKKVSEDSNATETAKTLKPKKLTNDSLKSNDIYIEENNQNSTPKLKDRQTIMKGFDQLIKSEMEKQQASPDFEKQNTESKAKSIFSSGKKQDAKDTAKSTSKTQHPLLKEEYTFENFVPGDNSNYAYEACLAAAKNPGNKKYSPILLYGGPGLGKTHLMQAVGNYIFSQNQNLKISYISTESLMNEFTLALREKTNDKFQKKYRNLDVLLLDDIQFLERSEKLQEEIFYMFNEIHGKNGQLIFTCDRPLTEVQGITKRLSSRFTQGLNIDITIPDYETRKAILEKKLAVLTENHGQEFPEEVIDIIAKRIQTNVRDLESCALNLFNMSELMGTKITIKLAEEVLRNIIDEPIVGAITIDTVQKVVADHYSLSISDLKSTRRKKAISKPRQIAMYIIKDMTEYSLADIGEEFGGKDHSTVIHSIEKIREEININPALEGIIKSLERSIREYKK